MKATNLHKASRIESIRNVTVALAITGSLFTPIMAKATATNEDLYQTEARYGDWITTTTEDSNHPSSSENRFLMAGTFGITSKGYMLGMSCSPNVDLAEFVITLPKDDFYLTDSIGETFTFNIQIDSNPIAQIRAEVYNETSMKLSEVVDDTFFLAMEKGVELKIEIVGEKQTRYPRFSLMGMKKAVKTTYNKCVDARDSNEGFVTPTTRKEYDSMAEGFTY